MMSAKRAEPEHIAISKSAGIKIDWKDGHRSEYGLSYLRENCPCATCAGTHGPPTTRPEPQGSNPFQMYKPALRIQSVEPVGTYAVKIYWSDGHSSGIYSYDHFRAICPCHECKATDATPAGQAPVKG
jgi:DUF971 family protein